MLAFAMPSVAHAGAVKGHNFDCVNDPGSYAGNSTVESDMGAATSSWVRIPIDWSRFETSNGGYDSTFISDMTACFTAAHSNGQNVLVDLTGPFPSWDSNPYNNPANYEAAAEKIGSLFPASNSTDGVQALEVWNEPDVSSNWNGTVDQYATFLSETDSGMHLEESGIDVVLAGTSHLDYTFDSGVMTATSDFDVLGIHPYPNNPGTYYDDPSHYLSSGVNNSLSGLQGLMASNGYGSRAMWATEMGFVPDSSLTDSQQATGLTDFYNYVRNSGCTGCSNVKMAAWFISYAPALPDSDSAFLPYSLIGATFNLKAQYTAFKNLSSS